MESWTIYGTAGTVTTAGAVMLGLKRFRRDRINGLKMGRVDLERIYERLPGLTCAQRLKVPGMERGRKDVMIPGIAILRTILRILKKEHFVITDYSLLEGLALSLIRTKGGLA